MSVFTLRMSINGVLGTVKLALCLDYHDTFYWKHFQIKLGDQMPTHEKGRTVNYCVVACRGFDSRAGHLFVLSTNCCFV